MWDRNDVTFISILVFLGVSFSGGFGEGPVWVATFSQCCFEVFLFLLCLLGYGGYHVSACRSPLYIISRWCSSKGPTLCRFGSVIKLDGDCPKKGPMNGLYSFGGGDACEQGDHILGYHGLIWLKFEMANLFSEVLGVLGVVWGVANHGRQDGG